MRRIGLAALISAALSAGMTAPVAAQTQDTQTGMKPAGDEGGMSGEMQMESSGDADIDFARAMIVHHEGAIDMSKTVLAEGDDPDIRGLASRIVAAQEEEITFLEAWLAENDQ